jgi:hypothetical protein
MSALTDLLGQRAAEVPRLAAVVGLDGFVDEMIQVVGERRSLADFTPMAGISDFAGWAQAAAGRSALREIVVHRQDAGGCALNLGDGLAALGVGVDLYATLGQPVHPAFTEALRVFRRVVPVGDVYGRTLALEFGDGKLMLSAVAQLAQLDAALAERAILGASYAEACAQAQLIALTNWTLYPHMTAVWQLLSQRVFAGLDNKALFLDLVDPTSRSEADIRALLALLPRLAPRCHVALGVNLNEANVLARLLGVATASDEPESLHRTSRALTAAIGVTEVVIHAVRFAANPGAAVAGPYCAKPVKLTGAGDRFNAGYSLGLMLRLPEAQRLELGNAASGFFVRQARSANVAQLAAFVGGSGAA